MALDNQEGYTVAIGNLYNYNTVSHPVSLAKICKIRVFLLPKLSFSISSEGKCHPGTFIGSQSFIRIRNII